MNATRTHRQLAIVAAGTALAALALAAVAVSSVRWQRFAPAYCLPDQCFCEAIRPGPIAQPADTWSALAYVTVALAVLVSRDASEPRPGTGGLSRGAFRVAFAAAMLVLGVGTAALHGTLRRFGSWLDLLGMYAFGSLVAVDTAARVVGLGPRAVASLVALCNAALVALLWFAPRFRRDAFAVLLVVMAATVVLARVRLRARARGPWMPAAAVVLALSLAVWLADITRRLCAPQSWLQGHALWHLGTAAAAWMLFQHLRTETPAP